MTPTQTGPLGHRCVAVRLSGSAEIVRPIMAIPRLGIRIAHQRGDRGWVIDMALVTSSGFAHVRITVTDIARSTAFYGQVFGWPTAVDASGSVDEPRVTDSPEQFYGGTVYEPPQGTLFGLRPVGSGAFGAERTGLDHVSFAVAVRADLGATSSAVSGGTTVMVTLAVALAPPPSVAGTVKTSDAGQGGAVNVGVAVSAPASTTVGPDPGTQA